jgi:hypothetical protein
MNSQIVITYILKTILISGIFLAYYWIGLRDKKFHYYNRFYLLTVSIMSLVIPLLNFNWFIVEEPVLYSSNEIVQFILPISNTNKSIQYDWVDYSLVIAGIIAITLLGILLLNILKIQLLKRNNEVTQMDGFEFINTNEDNAPFSFLNNLFWKKSISLQEEGGQQIFKHEITHIQQKHTWDRIYCQILTSIFWMNPFNWVIQKELVTIHEFIADESAVGNSNVEAFAKMLLQTHFGNHFLNPTHQFFYSSIKRRLTMLTKSTNTKYSYLRRVMVLPILIATVFLVSIKVNASDKIEKTSKEIKNTIDLLVSDTTKSKKITPPTHPNPSQAKPDYYINVAKIEFKGDIDTAVGDKKTPLYIIDGVPLKSSIEVSKLNEEEFESMSVLRNPLSISQYGNEGKNGVILITTKTGLKGNLQNKSDQTKVYEYSAKEGLDGDVYYKKIEDGTVNGYGNNKAETNVPIKVSNVPVKVTNLPVKVTNVPKIQSKTDTVPKAKVAVLKGQKIKVATKTTLDTIVYTSPTSGSKVTVSGVRLKQNVLDALEKKANTIIERKTETGNEKYIIVNSKAGDDAIKPTFYLDGVKITENEMKAISPNDIESINILKGEQAINKYHEAGKSGVVEIKLKHKN